MAYIASILICGNNGQNEAARAGVGKAATKCNIRQDLLKIFCREKFDRLEDK